MKWCAGAMFPKRKFKGRSVSNAGSVRHHGRMDDVHVSDSVFASQWHGDIQSAQSGSDGDSVDVEMIENVEECDVDEEEEIFWTPGDPIDTGCDLLDRFLKKITALRWDINSQYAPWKNIFHAGCDFIFHQIGISEAKMDVILGIFHWWSESGERMSKEMLPTSAKALKREHEKIFPDMGEFVERVDVPASRTSRPGRLFFLSSLLFVAMHMLTPKFMSLREKPLDETTWREDTVFATLWARKYHHLTAPDGWAQIFDGTDKHFISRGSVIGRDAEWFVVMGTEQAPSKSLDGKTFTEISRFSARDARGIQHVRLRQVDRFNGELLGMRGDTMRVPLRKRMLWNYAGQVEDFICHEGWDWPKSAKGLTHGLTPKDDMWVWGANMDGTGMFQFSSTLDETEMLYLRDWPGRVSYKHMVWDCGASLKGVDPSLLVGMLGRDVALTEQRHVRTLQARSDGRIVWKRIHMHLATLQGDRRGMEPPLGKLHSGSGTRNERKDFRGAVDGFEMGPRGVGPHAFCGQERIFPQVCV